MQIRIRRQPLRDVISGHGEEVRSTFSSLIAPHRVLFLSSLDMAAYFFNWVCDGAALGTRRFQLHLGKPLKLGFLLLQLTLLFLVVE